ncbi:MAG: DoxX family protein [Thermomicrobia bacterium]|nr:DoxX family protein [Thermomicrobia bacterium]
MLKSIGRLCLSGIFIVGGAEALTSPGPRTGMAEGVGIPEPETAVKVNGATMVVAGMMLALGIAPKAAAGALIGTLIPTTLVGHAFWKEEQPKSQSMQRIQFLKNLGLLGGLLWVLAEVSEEAHAKNHVEVEMLPL